MHKFTSSRVCCVSDIHIGVHQNKSNWHDITVKWAGWLRDELEKNNINDIIISGDLFHYRDEIAVNTIKVAYDVLSIWRDFNILVLVGNHDSYYKDRVDVNSLTILKGWPNITVIDTPEQLIHNDKKIMICPWGTTIREIDDSDIIFGHFEIETFKLNQHKVCTEGIKSSQLLKKSDLVITGHFHLREERKYKNGTVLYLGSPYQMDFGDVESSKGYYILDIDSKKYTFTENNISPKHKKVTLSELVSYKRITDEVKKIFHNNIVKLIIDKNIAPDEIEILFNKLSTLDANSITVDYAINFDRFNINENEEKDLSGVDVAVAIEEFIDLLDVEDKEDIKKYVTSVYVQCK